MSLFFMLKAGHSNPVVITLSGFDATSKTSSITVGSDRPIVSLRLKTDGTLQMALGDTGSALVYNDIGSDYLIGSTDGSLFEAQVTNNSEAGAAGTLVGTVGSFLELGTQRTWTWTKDTTSIGTATLNIDLEVREIADTSNTVLVASEDFVAQVEA